MTLELDPYYQNLMTSKGRSASICAASCAEPGANHGATSEHMRGHSNAVRTCSGDQLCLSRGSNGHNNGGNASPRKIGSGTHRSQSARVVGSNRPKVKKRDAHKQLQDYQKHLDLASSDSALQDCQSSYNPFLNQKLSSSGRLITSTSLEMSNNSLYSTPPPPSQPVVGMATAHQVAYLGDMSKDSPKSMRRHSSAVRRSSADHVGGSDRPELNPVFQLNNEMMNVIPMIATPESSPCPNRRNSRPTGLPKSPQPPRSNSARRAQSMKSPRKSPNSSSGGGSNVPSTSKSGGNENSHGRQSYLDVPESSAAASSSADEDEESYRLRSFSVTRKGMSSL